MSNGPAEHHRDRIQGEGLVIRVNWQGFQEASDPNAYNPKYAYTFETVIERTCVGQQLYITYSEGRSCL